MVFYMIQILVLIYVGERGLDGVQQYESQVIPILREYGGTLMTVFNPQQSSEVSRPDEVHLLEFPTECALNAYRTDPRVAALAEERNSVISKTELYISEKIVSYY